MTYIEMQNLLKGKGIIVSDGEISKMDEYLHLLLEWNERFNLTSITNKEDAIEKHFYDSLLASDPNMLKKGVTVADLGTGAGFPGIVWAIVYPESSFTLVEATKKKCSFLEEVVKVLNIPNVKVINSRIEELPSSFKESFDIVTARALAELRILLELSIPLLKVHGTFIAMKGFQAKEELDRAEHALKVLNITNIDIRHASLPNFDGERNNIYLTKGKKTDKRYPRKYADMLKKPL